MNEPVEGRDKVSPVSHEEISTSEEHSRNAQKMGNENMTETLHHINVEGAQISQEWSPECGSLGALLASGTLLATSGATNEKEEDACTIFLCRMPKERCSKHLSAPSDGVCFSYSP